MSPLLMLPRSGVLFLCRSMLPRFLAELVPQPAARAGVGIDVMRGVPEAVLLSHGLTIVEPLLLLVWWVAMRGRVNAADDDARSELARS